MPLNTMNFLQQFQLELADLADLQLVEVAARTGVNRNDLLFDRERGVLRLLQ